VNVGKDVPPVPLQAFVALDATYNEGIPLVVGVGVMVGVILGVGVCVGVGSGVGVKFCGLGVGVATVQRVVLPVVKKKL
jgi:hypothetical protein